jgi:hypothetical protein
VKPVKEFTQHAVQLSTSTNSVDDHRTADKASSSSITSLSSLLAGSDLSDMFAPSRGAGGEAKIEDERQRLVRKTSQGREPFYHSEHPKNNPSSLRSQVFARLGLNESSALEEITLDIGTRIKELSHPSAAVRIAAAHIVGNRGHTETSETKKRILICLILMAWRDADWRGRVAAVRALGKLGTPDVAEALEITLRDPHPSVRMAAALALGDIKDSITVTALVSASRDAYWGVRAAALQSMGKLKNRVFLNSIHAALDDENCSVRIEALQALWHLKGTKAHPLLSMIAQRDYESQVREAALMVLEMLNDSMYRDSLSTEQWQNIQIHQEQEAQLTLTDAFVHEGFSLQEHPRQNEQNQSSSLSTGIETENQREHHIQPYHSADQYHRAYVQRVLNTHSRPIDILFCWLHHVYHRVIRGIKTVVPSQNQENRQWQREHCDWKQFFLLL